MRVFLVFCTIEDIKLYIRQLKLWKQRLNKLIDLEDSMVMYGVYSAEKTR